MRKNLIAGNWKMNCTGTQARQLAAELTKLVGSVDAAEVAIAPPYTAIQSVHETIASSKIILAAQDLHWEEQGAFTGKVSADMLKDAGVTMVIIGHSEQRSYFHETDATVNKKVHAAIKHGLHPIICVGETIEERESGKMEAVVERQVRGAYQGVSADAAKSSVVAYEPVWAIGTGKTATPQMAQDAHSYIRKLLVSLFGESTANSIRILYGGSMKPENAKELLAMADIDGGLIGGAALKAQSFADIISAAG